MNVGKAARNCEQVLTKMEVVSVGRKYFKACPVGRPDWFNVQFYIDTWCEKSEYVSGHCLFESPQAWEDSKECAELNRFIGNHFGGWGPCKIKLEALRTIKGIIEANP